MSTVNPRFPLFDSLRAIAALSIVALHLAIRVPTDSSVRPYLFELGVGVTVFFLISGFLLYRPFARARYMGDGGPAAGPYAARRALRIVPAYWVALPIVVLLLGKAGEATNAMPVFSAHGVVAYFGFLQAYDSQTLLGGISAAWTLCVEVAFYAMLPLWAMLLRRVPCRSAAGFLRSELLALAGIYVMAVTWVAITAPHARAPAIALLDVTRIKPWLYVLPAYLDQFALGMALAVLSVVAGGQSRQPRPLRLIDRAPWLPVVVAAAAFFLIAHVNGWIDGFALQFLTTHALQGIFALGLLLPAAFGDPDRGVIRKVLANRVLLWIGLVSYGVYLWHDAVIAKLYRLDALHGLGTAGFIAVSVAVSLVLGAASFYLVERHALRLARRVSRRRRSQDADARMRDLARHERPEPGLP